MIQIRQASVDSRYGSGAGVLCRVMRDISVPADMHQVAVIGTTGGLSRSMLDAWYHLMLDTRRVDARCFGYPYVVRERASEPGGVYGHRASPDDRTHGVGPVAERLAGGLEPPMRLVEVAA